MNPVIKLNPKNFKALLFLLLIACSSMFFSMTLIRAIAAPVVQIPTGSIATVTGTPVGAIATVLDNEQGFVNLRSGPSTVAYDIVGVLIEQQVVPALGRSPGGDWIQVSYPGGPGGIAWVWSDLVEVRGTLPVVEPPPTQTPLVTSTIDPTLAAQFLIDVPPTRLPTFTEPVSISLPTFPADTPEITPGRVPTGFLIIGLAVIGLFGTILSILTNR